MDEKDEGNKSNKSPNTAREENQLDSTNYQTMTMGRNSISTQQMELTLQILMKENEKLKRGIQKAIDGNADQNDLKTLLENDMAASIGRNSSPSIKGFLFGASEEREDPFHKTVPPKKKINFDKDEINAQEMVVIDEEPTKQTNKSQIIQSNLVNNQTSREELEAFEAEMDNLDQTMPRPFIREDTLLEQQSDELSRRSSPLSLRHNSMMGSPVRVKYAKGDHMYKQDKKQVHKMRKKVHDLQKQLPKVPDV